MYTPALKQVVPHIGTGELVGNYVGLERDGPSLVAGVDGDNRVLVRIDNTQANAAINKGWSPSPLLDEWARAYGDLAWSMELDVAAIHIPGNNNTRADALSRLTETPKSSDQALTAGARGWLENNFALRHTAEGFSDGLGRNSKCPRWCWVRRSFFKEDLAGEDWFVNPDFELLEELVQHLLKEAPKQWAATLIWPRLGTLAETKLRLLLPRAGFILMHRWPQNTALFEARPSFVVWNVFPTPLPPVRNESPTPWPVEVWRRTAVTP
jgi:hypothetical protein